MSYYANGPSSVSGLVDYINSPLLKDDLKDEDDYFAGYYPIYIDLRNSSGITELPDNIIRNDGKARVLITLKNTLASTYVLTCTGISTYASYRTVFKDGQKKIVFSTLHPAGNTTTTPAVPYRTNI